MAKLRLIEFSDGLFAYRKTWFGFIHRYLDVRTTSAFNNAMEASLINPNKRIYKIGSAFFNLNAKNTENHCRRIYEEYLNLLSSKENEEAEFQKRLKIKKIHKV